MENIMADAGELKSINRNAIRNILKINGTVSKNFLVRKTGLSFPTISRAVDLMVSIGELLENGAGCSTGGRRAQLYTLNPLYKVILSLCLESDDLRWFVSGLAGENIEHGTERCSAGILTSIRTLVMRVQVRYPQLGAIAMGFAGNVRQGIVMEVFGHDELRGVNLSAYLQTISGLPCAVEGDMQIVATGYWSRCADPPEAAVCIYLGNLCMGGGIIIHGHAWHGTSSFAGELHYLPVEHNPNGVHTHFEGVDIVAYYAKVIRSYIAILNPDRIVLYENEFLSGKIDDIRKASINQLPLHAIPQIALSCEFEEDYDKGLFTLGSRMIESP